MRPRLWFSLSLALLMLMSRVPPANAHADLVRSSPVDGAQLAVSPRQVGLWFNEELDTGASWVRVVDGDGRPVDAGDGQVDLYDPEHASMLVSLPPLPDGVYTVRWHAVTPDDGGLTEGEFKFAVGDPPATVGDAGTPLPILVGRLALGLAMIALLALVVRAQRR